MIELPIYAVIEFTQDDRAPRLVQDKMLPPDAFRLAAEMNDKATRSCFLVASNFGSGSGPEHGEAPAGDPPPAQEPEIVAPPEISGRLQPGTPVAMDRLTWVVHARDAGIRTAHLGRALGINERTVRGILENRSLVKSRVNHAGTRAMQDKFWQRRHGAVNGVTYAELHAMGLTALEAAARRGESFPTANRWAREVGCKWHDSRKREEYLKANLARIQSPEFEKKRLAGLMRYHADPKLQRTAAMTEAERDLYRLLRNGGARAEEACIQIGRPDLAPSAFQKQKAERLQAVRRKRAFAIKVKRSPESALLELMTRDQMQN